VNQTATFLVVTVFVLLGLLAVATSIIAVTLKRKHPRVWAAEGKPEQWIWLTKAPPGQHIFGFLDERRYLTTGDTRLARVCAAVRVGWYAFFVLLLVAMGAFAVALLTGGQT
jgi:hypothetical protein